MWALKTQRLNPSAGRIGFCKSDCGQRHEGSYSVSPTLWKVDPGPWTQMFFAREEKMERSLLSSTCSMCLASVRER